MKDRSGVSNVVSLIMIAGILISLMGMVFSTYLPAWGKDIEVRTQSEILDSIMDLKSGMDVLAVSGDPGTSMTTKVTLGSNGGPIFGFGHMTGSIQLYQNEGVMEITDELGASYVKGRGRVEYSSYNVEIDDIKISLEGGAIIRDQATSPVMKGAPNIVIMKESGTGDLSMYVLVPTIEGTTQSYTGTGTYMVKTSLTIDQYTSYDIAAGKTISLMFHTDYADIWKTHLTTIVSDQGLVANIDYTLTIGGTSEDSYVQLSMMTLDRLDIRNDIYTLAVN